MHVLNQAHVKNIFKTTDFQKLKVFNVVHKVKHLSLWFNYHMHMQGYDFKGKYPTSEGRNTLWAMVYNMK